MPTITSQQELPKAAAAEPVPQQAPSAAAEPKKEDAKEPERLSPQFAALARKEKALRLEAQKIKLERESIKAEQEKLKSSDYVPKNRLTNETLQVLAEAGLNHDDIAALLLNGPKPKSGPDPMIAKLMARIDELEGNTKKIETEFKDNQSKAYDQAVNQIRNDAKILVDSDPAYETIKIAGKVEEVVKHIQTTFKEDGILLSVQDAAKEVEEELVAIGLNLAGASKIKAKLQPIEASPKQEPVPKQSQTKTLTHDMTSAPKTNMTAKDRYKRAVLRASGLDPDTGKPLAQQA